MRGKATAERQRGGVKGTATATATAKASVRGNGKGEGDGEWQDRGALPHTPLGSQTPDPAAPLQFRYAELARSGKNGKGNFVKQARKG